MRNYITSRSLRVGLLLLLCASCLWKTAESHGFLIQPMGRSFVSYKFDPPEKRNYNPQGANAGGKQHVYNNGQLHWPNGRFGICGDPWDASPKPLEQAGRITARYSPGSIVTIHLLITANHWGRMQFSLCPRGVTAQDFKQRCTALQRLDGRGAFWTLPPGEKPDPQGRPLIPTYSDSSFSYYIYPENDDFRDTPVYVLKYKLPAGYRCEGCVLHWYWLTGNSCNPPCDKSDPLYPNCNRLQMGYCGDPKALNPEEFWGCSDIYIGDEATKKPHINSSWDQLSERLRSAMELQDRTGKPQHPVLPNKADYWRAELLAANELLDQMYHHGPHTEQPVVPQPVVVQPTLPPGSVVSGVEGEQTSQVEGEATGVVEVSSGTTAESVAALGAEEGAHP